LRVVSKVLKSGNDVVIGPTKKQLVEDTNNCHIKFNLYYEHPDNDPSNPHLDTYLPIIHNKDTGKAMDIKMSHIPDQYSVCNPVGMDKEKIRVDNLMNTIRNSADGLKAKQCD
jgi:hypothetical protein